MKEIAAYLGKRRHMPSSPSRQHIDNALSPAIEDVHVIAGLGILRIIAVATIAYGLDKKNSKGNFNRVRTFSAPAREF